MFNCPVIFFFLNRYNTKIEVCETKKKKNSRRFEFSKFFDGKFLKSKLLKESDLLRGDNDNRDNFVFSIRCRGNRKGFYR